jgi:hypothetical protein
MRLSCSMKSTTARRQKHMTFSLTDPFKYPFWPAAMGLIGLGPTGPSTVGFEMQPDI